MEIERRTVLQAGGILAVGGLVAACSSGSGDAAVASEAPAGSAPAGSAPAASAPASTSSGGAGVAQVSDIPVGGGVIIDEPAVVITQPAEGEVKAFTAICTHQGCLVVRGRRQRDHLPLPRIAVLGRGRLGHLTVRPPPG